MNKNWPKNTFYSTWHDAALQLLLTHNVNIWPALSCVCLCLHRKKSREPTAHTAEPFHNSAAHWFTTFANLAVRQMIPILQCHSLTLLHQLLTSQPSNPSALSCLNQSSFSNTPEVFYEPQLKRHFGKLLLTHFSCKLLRVTPDIDFFFQAWLESLGGQCPEDKEDFPAAAAAAAIWHNVMGL